MTKTILGLSVVPLENLFDYPPATVVLHTTVRVEINRKRASFSTHQILLLKTQCCWYVKRVTVINLETLPNISNSSIGISAFTVAVNRLPSLLDFRFSMKANGQLGFNSTFNVRTSVCPYHTEIRQMGELEQNAVKKVIVGKLDSYTVPSPAAVSER